MPASYGLATFWNFIAVEAVSVLNVEY